MKNNDLTPLIILEKLDLFYNNAWEKLIIYNTIFLALIGIIIPIIIQWWQSRNLKLKEESLKKELYEFFHKKNKDFESNMISTIDEKITAEVKDIKQSMLKMKAGLEGSHFHIQANSVTEPKEKLKSLIWSASGYVKGEDFLNLVPVLEMVITELPSLTKEDITEIFVEDADLDALIVLLEELDNNSTFVHLIRKIKILINKMPDKPIIKV